MRVRNEHTTGTAAAPPRRLARLQRLCAATGEVRPVDEMIRFVAGPDHTAIPDLKCRLPGRGVWITGTRPALELALKRKSFERGFKCQICVPCDLVAMTERLLEKAALDALAMCQKAGKVVLGFARLETALARGSAVAVLHALEASPEGVRKLKPALGAHSARPVVLSAFTAVELDLALGRSNVIHAGLLASSETGTFLARVARLDRFRIGALAGAAAAAEYGLPALTKVNARRTSAGEGRGKRTMVESG
ncbi:MAG TPA: RNA-binding protein [Xanthobacteraceae bacterium]|jgi:hypothetical protein